MRMSNVINKGSCSIALVGSLGIFLGLVDLPLGKANAASVVVQNEAFGNSYGDWSAMWWQWTLSIPAATNPNFGGDCTQGQSGNVWFLAGSFDSIPAIRNCVIPAPKPPKKPVNTVFFPMINAIGFKAFGYQTLNDLRQQAPPRGANLDNVTKLVCTIDGTDCATLCQTDDGSSCPTTDLFAFRATSPSFSVLAPAQGVLPPGMLTGPGSGDPLVSDGYWMLVTLPSGKHTIHFGGTTADGFVEDVTYNLTVP